VSQLRVAALASVALALVLAVGGCSEDAAKPKPLPSSSESPSASPTSNASESTTIGESPPAMPRRATGHSETSAKAFVRYWVSVLNYSAVAGDTSALRKLSDARCVQCAAIASLIDRVYEADGAIRGRGWTVRSVRAEGVGAKPNMRVLASVKVNPQTIRITAGEPATRYKGGMRNKYFRLTPTTGTWMVTRLDQPE
jgi:hypothetical protein